MSIDPNDYDGPWTDPDKGTEENKDLFPTIVMIIIFFIFMMTR